MRLLSLSFFRLFPLAFAFAFSFSIACTSQPAPEQVRLSASPHPVAASGCNDEDGSFCTREYRPTLCSWNGENFSGNNPCEAKKLARRYACDKNLVYTEGDVACRAKEEGIIPVQLPAKDCESKVFCTREFDPQRCTYRGETFEGSNRCAALQKIRSYTCRQGLALNESEASCQALRDGKEPTR